MQKIRIEASASYDILIGQDILPRLLTHPAGLSGIARVAVISDDHVAPLHLSRLTSLLEEAGIAHESYILPHGESSKDLSHLGEILTFLAGHKFSAADRILALGGGVVGDITALAAALYLRGVPFLQIPTTLLAAVDSSVGGKCAVDLPQGKNLVGTFYQPRLVLCDTALLGTLPEEEFACGMAEVIKYALGFDKELFSLLEVCDVKSEIERIIARCVEIKRDVVEADEFDRGERKKLNLGHTPAHAIEALSDFSTPHGIAVGMGLALMGRACLSPDEADRVDALLCRHRLPLANPYTAEELAEAALADKKRLGAHLSLILPKSVGSCEICETPVSDLAAFFSRGLV